METKATQYRDSKEFFDEIDEHVKSHDDIQNRNHFQQMANRSFLASRRNKGGYKIIK